MHCYCNNLNQFSWSLNNPCAEVTLWYPLPHPRWIQPQGAQQGQPQTGVCVTMIYIQCCCCRLKKQCVKIKMTEQCTRSLGFQWSSLNGGTWCRDLMSTIHDFGAKLWLPLRLRSIRLPANGEALLEFHCSTIGTIWSICKSSERQSPKRC